MATSARRIVSSVSATDAASSLASMRLRRRMPAVSTRRTGRPFHSHSTLNRITRNAGLGAGEHALLAHQPVEQRRLADVGPSDDGQQERPRRRQLAGIGVHRGLGVQLLLVFLRHRLDVTAERFVQVAEALAVFGGDRDRLAQPQPVGFRQPLLCRSGLRTC